MPTITPPDHTNHIKQGEIAGREIPEVEKPLYKGLDIEILREKGKTIFRFQIDPRIEKLYKERAKEIRPSTSWPSLNFYYCPDITEDENYQAKLSNYRLFDDYGTGLYKTGHNGRMNIAWIRTVGGKGDIIIKDSGLSIAELTTLFRGALQFIRVHWEDSFKDFHIKGSLKLEI